MSYPQQQMSSSFNHKPTHFVTSSPNLISIGHSRGASLIMPANNQIQAMSFHAPNHPANYHPTALVTDAQSDLLSSSSGKMTITRLQKIDSNQTTEAPSNSLRNYLQGSIELALRQASGDDNVFQPSSAIPIDTPHQNFESWSSSHLSKNNNNNPLINDQLHSGGYEHNQHHRNTSVMEQSNNIAQNELPSSTPVSKQIDNQHEFRMSSVQQNEYPSNESPISSIQPSIVANNINSTNPTIVELNNHVLYEGLATAPPAGDYYFSSSEKLPNSEIASNAWW